MTATLSIEIHEPVFPDECSVGVQNDVERGDGDGAEPQLIDVIP
jgi:hypothetical protein